jgi:hypothetical protein
MSEKIRPHDLQRKAILYIRQSSPYQVLHNLESQKLQYAMQEHLRRLGWQEIEIIDEDLGRSAAGMAYSPGPCRRRPVLEGEEYAASRASVLKRPVAVYFR